MKKGCDKVCVSVLSISIGEGQTLATIRNVIAFRHYRVEMGANLDRFCI